MRYLKRLTAELREFRKAFVPRIEEVGAQLFGKLLTSSDYREFMPNLRIELKPEAPLPINIFEILNRECPVYGPERLVKQTHLLAWIPGSVSLSSLSEALGGQEGKVLWSKQFLKEDAELAELTLAACGKGGHWALIPYKFQIETMGKNFNDSVAALKSEYVQADVISFTSALLLHAVKYPHNPRLYPDTVGWCKDQRIGTYTEKLTSKSGYPADSLHSLSVGLFTAAGLDVVWDNPLSVTLFRGCAAIWNFGT